MIELDNNNFQELIIDNKIPVVIDFWSDSCMPCKMLMGIINQVEMKFIGKVSFYKLNISNSEIANMYNIVSVPTILFLKDGVEVSRHIGLVPSIVLINKINNNFFLN